MIDQGACATPQRQVPTFTTGSSAHTFTLRLDNAGDRLYRNHLSFIKEQAAEPGRSLKLVYRVRF